MIRGVIKNRIFWLIIILCCIQTLVFAIAKEIRFDFDNDNSIEYDIQKIEVWQGKLRLAPTGFWTNTGELTNSTMPAMLFQDSKRNLFYLASAMGGGCVYKSSNYGINWKTTRSGIYHPIVMLEASDNNLYAGTISGGGVVKSYDNGDSWTNILIKGDYTGGLLEDSNKHLYVSINDYDLIPGWSTNYLLKSTDYGTNWNIIYKDGKTGGIASEMRFSWLFELNNGDLLAYYYYYKGIYISSNYGTNWSLIVQTSNYGVGSGVLRASDGNIYAYGDDGILKTEDEAQSWQVVSTEPCSELIEADDGIFYKTYQSNVWKSFDKGYSWHKTPNLIKDTVDFGKYLDGALIQADDGRIYVGAATNGYKGGYVFRSGYALSSQATLFFAPQYVNEWLSFSKSDNLNGGNIIYEFAYSTDNGNTWSEWLPLTDENLRNTPCKYDGNDRLKVRISLYSLNHSKTPEIDWISLQYTDKYIETLDNVIIAPNPFRPNKDNIDYVMFYNLPAQFEIKVYSIGGGEVFHTTANSIAGCWQWNVKNNDGKMLKSGVYIIYIEDTKGAQKILNLVVIR